MCEEGRGRESSEGKREGVCEREGGWGKREREIV